MRSNEAKLIQPEVEAWLKRQPRAETDLELSVVVPAYNEQWRLPTTLIDMIDYLDAHRPGYEIIVVDDGSSDATAETVKKFERIRDRVRLLRSARNHGKGHAVRVGMLNARGRRILFADADGATPIEEIERLLKAMDGGADVAIGSRAIYSQETQVKTRWYRKFLGRAFNLCVNALLLPKIADTQCGFKMFTAEAAHVLFERQTADGFSFDVEILFLARRTGFAIAEVPINWTNVPGSKVNLIFDALKMFRDVMIFKVRHRGIGPEARETARETEHPGEP